MGTHLILCYSSKIESLPDKLDTLTAEMKELKDLKSSLKDTHPIGELVSVTKTVDQVRHVP